MPRLLTFALFVAALLLPSARLQAAAFELGDDSWEGCEQLLDLARRELGTERVVVLSTLDWGKLQHSDGVWVLHPTRAVDPEEAAAFMKAGGRLAMADDYGMGDRLLEHFKIKRTVLPTHPAARLRGKTALAVATPVVDEGGAAVGIHPTVANVEQVVLNHGTGLRHPQLTSVLEVRSSEGPAVAVAVAGKIDGPVHDGRLFAMGDPSVFINQMLRYPGNRAFAVGLLHYLADGDATEVRRGRLFILVNDFEQQGAFGGVTPLRKTLDRKLSALLEALETMRDSGFPWWLHLLAAALMALLVLKWASRGLFKQYRRRRPRFARPVPRVAQGGLAGRVAVLSSRASSPALVLLELRSVFSEALGPHLGLGERASPEGILARMTDTEKLAAPLASEVRQVLVSMRAAESAVVAGAASRVTIQEVQRAAVVIQRVFERLALRLPWPPGFAGERMAGPPIPPIDTAATRH